MKQTKAAMLSGVSGYRSAKIIENNTLRIDLENGDTAIRLHNTDIVTIHKDGSQTLNSGGWRTVTTKDRINKYSAARICQEGGVWYVGDPADGVLFEDGIKITAGGAVISGAGKDTKKKDAAMLKKIRAYAALYVAPYPMPSKGDCWFCSIRDVAGKPWGDHRGDDYQHLRDHMSEKYVMGSLLINALRERGYQDAAIGIVLHAKHDGDIGSWHVKADVTKYLKRRLLPHLAR